MKQLVRITKQSGIPLIGTIAFGIIDRGTDLLQIRPTSACNLNCAYCSTDSGACSISHETDYTVDMEYLLEYVKDAADYKGTKIEANIDSVGEPLTYDKITELVGKLAKMSCIKRISMQTNGMLLTEDLLKKLEKAGLNRINLSINTLDEEQAMMLSGTPGYSLKKVLATAKNIAESKIELLIAPVWIPGVNEAGIEGLIQLAKKLDCKIGIQKYETYKHSRRIPKARPINYWKFYKQLEAWEKEFGIKLKFTAKDSTILAAKRLPEKFKQGDKEIVEIKCPGWMKGQMIGAARNRAVTVNDCKAVEGDKIKVKITEAKNNIYLAEPI